ncbi:hypothetical protein MA16_Dca020682 [Dendrobium catenatum]|uniref:Uncharacterized protein n=1 Tax=Dendrobium catenatum TaxID=906689 RepID=A0A2I0WGW6_9ASPA|nr:hypothetical protein MA16_Dca020682 [Dendrobium catenatum]
MGFLEYGALCLSRSLSKGLLPVSFRYLSEKVGVFLILGAEFISFSFIFRSAADSCFILSVNVDGFLLKLLP